jgi:hypothetical protein
MKQRIGSVNTGSWMKRKQSGSLCVDRMVFNRNISDYSTIDHAGTGSMCVTYSESYQAVDDERRFGMCVYVSGISPMIEPS